MKVDLHLHLVTEDPFPTPWRCWFSVDTVYGNYTDEGLYPTEEAAVTGAEQRIVQWLRDRRTSRDTKRVVTIDVDVEALTREDTDG